LSICSAYGQDQKIFFVSPDGNDKNSCTHEKPFKSITRVRDTIQILSKCLNNDILALVSIKKC
jgi:hypothetical protein